MLYVHELEVRYGKISGTRKLSFQVPSATTLALVGSNGAGKSSTLKAIAGLNRDYGGCITWNGEDLTRLKPDQVVIRGVAFSPEGRRVFAALSVRDNLRMGAFTRTRGDFAERVEQIYAYFPRLKERFNQAAGNLSGGEQQMLAIGRALMSRPSLFLLDEPSLGLAPIITERIGDILLEVQAREGLSIVLAEQNANWAMRLAQRAVILELGQKVMEGEASVLLLDSRVQEAYLGV
jgi:branched-chain amino acid transport system ATP-binding protein